MMGCPVRFGGCGAAGCWLGGGGGGAAAPRRAPHQRDHAARHKAAGDVVEQLQLLAALLGVRHEVAEVDKGEGDGLKERVAQGVLGGARRLAAR
jgi:hypothetical protein